MAVLVEMHHTGDPALRRGVVAIVDHVLSESAREKVHFFFGWSWLMIYVYFSELRL
jgi:hypothetical protein